MKYLLFSFALPWLFACQPTTNSGAQSNQQTYLTFEFSKEPAVMKPTDPSNWCMATFGEAALINADPNNYSRRIFTLNNVPNRIVVELGHQAANFMLEESEGKVKIYTSDNLPACMSNKSNFQISPDGLSFRYNNNRDVSFDVYLQQLPGGLQFALDLPPGGGHGLTVVRCEACK